MLPLSLRAALERQIADVRALHAADVAAGAGLVALPYALARKYPNGEREFAWQYVFPATRNSIAFAATNANGAGCAG